jgi:hypothetical protein
VTTPLAAAHRYAELGFRVVPIAPGGKNPLPKAWQDEATIDQAVIDAWWQLWADAGVGLLTGDGRFVLDVDFGHDGKIGDRTLAQLEAEYGALPPTVEARSARGGRHLWFRLPEGVVVRNRKIGPDLETRGQGGQVLVWPTFFDGRQYTWVPGHTPDLMEVAMAPQWLIDLLIDPEPAPRPKLTVVQDRPGDVFEGRTDWSSLLFADGWTLHHTDQSGEQHWTRPGKERREGTSATVGYMGSDVLKVFSSAVPHLDADATYTRFGYWAATRFGGDHAACARHLAKEQGSGLLDWVENVVECSPSPWGPVASETDTEGPEAGDLFDTPDDRWAEFFIDWTMFWEQDHGDEEWLAYPLIPKGRLVSLYAPAKAGKSLVALDVVASIATGRPVLGGRAETPTHVLYLDYEMNQSELYDRLTDFGYDADTDLSHLHYALLPSIPFLDTDKGGETVVTLAQRVHAELVVIDTFGRAVAGDENDNDTARRFYQHTGMALKRAGIAMLRVDHAGKDIEKGQRGGSAKNDDVDVVWQLIRDSDGFSLNATHRRMQWVPANVRLNQLSEPLRHHLTEQRGYPAGTRQLTDELDALDVSIDATVQACQAALKAAGTPRRKQLVAAAQRFRREQTYDWRRHETVIFGSGTVQKSGSEEEPEPVPEPDPPKASDQVRNQAGTDRNHEVGVSGSVGGSPVGGPTETRPAGNRLKDTPNDDEGALW